MLLRNADAKRRVVNDLHHGHGPVHGTILLADYARAAGGFKFIHDTILAPGVSIGVHRHVDDEEVYIVLEGRGEMVIDGVVEVVGPGDVCLTRGGHSHGLTNTGPAPMRLMVIGVNPSPRG